MFANKFHFHKLNMMDIVGKDLLRNYNRNRQNHCFLVQSFLKLTHRLMLSKNS